MKYLLNKTTKQTFTIVLERLHNFYFFKYLKILCKKCINYEYDLNIIMPTKNESILYITN